MITTTDPSNNSTMRIVESPASNDVLCGKDKTFNRNIGNMIYRQLIISTATRYARIKTKPEKMKITAHIVHTMMQQHKSRFLKQVMIQNDDDDDDSHADTHGSNYFWQEISITAARDKTSHALRFCASQMRLQSSHDEPMYVTSTTTTNTSTAPVTPTTERRSIRGRVQRKSIRYSPSTTETMTPIATAEKRTPFRHRRTVSSENASLNNPTVNMSSSSIDPNEYYHHPHNYYHENQQYYVPYHERNHHVQYKNENPIPMECTSESVPLVVNSNPNYDHHHHHHCPPHYSTAESSHFVNYYYRPPPPASAAGQIFTEKCNKDDEVEDDDLDAILREPIQWDDENHEEHDDDDDEGEEKKEADDAYDL
jgi:hypothetical protein